MSSTRLPGKVLRPLAGGPMILRQIERIRRAGSIDELVVATSTDRSDQVLTDVLNDAGIRVFRGPLQDVLARFAGALEAFGPADHVVRLTADCPLVDWRVIDTVIERLVTSGADYVSNTPVHRTYPHGLDVEAMRSSALIAAAAEADDPYEREHVTPFIYRRPERFRLEFVSQAAQQGDLRWTVDRPDDHQFAAAVYDGLYADHPAFTPGDVLAWLKPRTELHAHGGDRRF